MVGLKKRIGLERHLVVVLLYFLLLFLNRIFIVPLIAVIDENVYKVSFTRNERKQYLLTGVINSFGVIDKNSYQLLNVKNGDYIDFYSSNAIVSFPYERFQGPLWGARC